MKKFILLFAAAALSLSLAACGSEKTTSQETPDTAAEDVVIEKNTEEKADEIIENSTEETQETAE